MSEHVPKMCKTCSQNVPNMCPKMLPKCWRQSGGQFPVQPNYSRAKGSTSHTLFENDRLDRIEHMIQGCIDRGEVPGAIAILVKDGKIGYHKAFGWANIASKKPLETDSLVRIASMSKLVTTVAALQLYE